MYVPTLSHDFTVRCISWSSNINAFDCNAWKSWTFLLCPKLLTFYGLRNSRNKRGKCLLFITFHVHPKLLMLEIWHWIARSVHATSKLFWPQFSDHYLPSQVNLKSECMMAWGWEENRSQRGLASHKMQKKSQKIIRLFTKCMWESFHL